MDTSSKYLDDFPSPMQLGDSLLKANKTAAEQAQRAKKEARAMSEPKPHNRPCNRKGCDKAGAFHGFCAKDFHDEFGISYPEYIRTRKSKGEDPREVAKRLTGQLSAGPIDGTRASLEGQDKPLVKAQPSAGPLVIGPRETMVEIVLRVPLRLLVGGLYFGAVGAEQKVTSKIEIVKAKIGKDA